MRLPLGGRRPRYLVEPRWSDLGIEQPGPERELA